ncbi:hypothetical protein PIB30_006098 [Stylosanthes scabra]|uniref:Uncharacterized protein n=1 Tax=Stylosanthes scabra TaxID=79078 RepID=A0ABU6W5D1_9FABA|nr:hypothetical protein [Stylosanthes scabra]
MPTSPHVPIRPDTNRSTRIDPRIQFQDRLEKARAESIEKVKQSMRHLPSIPIIDIDADDELDDLLKVISETKVDSEQVVLNSKNKFVQQSVQREKEDTPIQKARTESMKLAILKSAAEKMIQLMNQLLELLQKDAYWNNELVVVTSCLVEQQFPDEYQEKVLYFGNIFEHLFLTRENLSNICLEAVMIKENCEGLETAETTLKEKDALYEKHFNNANDALNELSKERDDLSKKLAEIQAQIQEIDNKTMKLKKPFKKIQEKKLGFKNKLSEVEQSKKQNEEDLKSLQEEEDQEIELFKNY